MSFSLLNQEVRSDDRWQFCGIILHFIKKKKQIVTLQVRILFENSGSFLTRQGKKAFPSVSAAMTLEAALSLSLFLFAAVSLLLPMKIMNTERRLQAGLEKIGETISRYSYLQDIMETGELMSIPGADESDKDFTKSLGKGAAVGYAQAQILSYIDTENLIGVNFLRSSIREDGETIDLILDYEIQMPFPALGLRSISRTIRCRRRAWIGARNSDGSGSEERYGDDGDRVYVGRNGTRYHTDRNCHYLSNNLTEVSFEALEGKRNESGGKYHACRVCGYGAGAGDSVYIMPQGSSYHRTRNCSATIAYVQEVKREYAEHLGACSYCSK